ERMIGVDGDGVVGGIDDGEGHGLAVAAGGLEAGAEGGVDAVGDLGAGDGLDSFGPMGPIGGVGRDGDRLFFAHAHALDLIVQTLDDLAGTQLKFKGFAAGGGIEFRAVGEPSGVVDAHSIPVL